jgi:hypothetical protein
MDVVVPHQRLKAAIAESDDGRSGELAFRDPNIQVAFRECSRSHEPAEDGRSSRAPVSHDTGVRRCWSDVDDADALRDRHPHLVRGTGIETRMQPIR